MKNTLNYRGITLNLKKSVKHNIFYGRLVLGNRDEVTFECPTFSEVKKLFDYIVEDYLCLKEISGDSPLIIHYVNNVNK